ncbi:MAG: DNA/RNA non-specific endonuclease, partial [Lentisphaeria bacterium]|nr:DNA/RNA non-specific endonuclease [Lentisphaeria bacterium]
YKVVLDLTPPMKMIAFVIPNETSKRQLPSFSLSVDSVEKLTGYDFFSNLDDRQEDFLESHSDYTKWQ